MNLFSIYEFSMSSQRNHERILSKHRLYVAMLFLSSELFPEKLSLPQINSLEFYWIHSTSSWLVFLFDQQFFFFNILKSLTVYSPMVGLAPHTCPGGMASPLPWSSLTLGGREGMACSLSLGFWPIAPAGHPRYAAGRPSGRLGTLALPSLGRGLGLAAVPLAGLWL